MFPLPFRKKSEESKKVYIPVDLVLNYAAQGFSESEIISRLQAQGFASEHIDRAIRMALKERISSGLEVPQQPQPTLPQQSEQFGLSPQTIERHPMPLGYPPERIMTPEETGPLEARTSFTFEPPTQPLQAPMEEITIEELIEGIVGEKWREFEELLINFDKRDLQLQSEIEDLRKKIKEVDASLAEREKGLAGRFDDFGGSMENIEGRIGSIEKIFKEVLPELTENIKSMTEFVEKIKEEKK